MYLLEDDFKKGIWKPEEKTKVFISLPMRNMTQEIVLKKMHYIFNNFCKFIDREDMIFLNQYFKPISAEDYIKNYDAWGLADSLEIMAQASIVIFSDNYMIARGCRIEKEVCLAYDIPHTDEYIITKDIIQRNIPVKVKKTEYSPLLHTNVVVEEERDGR